MEPSLEDSIRLVSNSTLYEEFLAERQEILRHKWIESERVGYDIGFERALLNWILKYRRLGSMTGAAFAERVTMKEAARVACLSPDHFVEVAICPINICSSAGCGTPGR